MGFGAASVCFAIQSPMVMAQAVTRKGCTTRVGAGGTGTEKGDGDEEAGIGMKKFDLLLFQSRNVLVAAWNCVLV